MSTASYLVERWADDGDPDEWPYPTQYARFRIDGDLADRTRARTGQTGEVTIVEATISGGYSEYTQEDDYEFDVYVGENKVWSAGSTYRQYSENDDDLGKTTLSNFQLWLNDAA